LIETLHTGQSQLVDWHFGPFLPKRFGQRQSGLNMRHLRVALGLIGLLATQTAAQENAVVVELYTSQGCSSCPPADDILRALAPRDDVIALALHVDYWDYLGWVDLFGKAEHSARQQAYARVAEAKMIYTPQMIIGGTDHIVGSRPMQVMDAVQAHASQPYPFDLRLGRSGDLVSLNAGPGAVGVYDVQLVRYLPHQSVAIRNGENAGNTVDYANIVTSWVLLGQWDGAAPLAMQVQADGPEAVVAIIQQAGHGAIMGAARLR
jgi:hypothetical protein